MAKRQNRRSISIKGLTYQRLQGHCAAQGKSISGFLEDLITEKLDAVGVPMQTILRPRPRPKLSVEEESIADQHFTF